MNKLVETRWLAEHLNDHDLVIIDASPTEEYVSMHIKNAVSASFSPEDYLSYGINTSYGGGVDLFTDPDSPIPFQDGPPEYIAEVARSLGVNQNSTVVVYDNGANFLATRVFWTLTFHGYEKVFILNGGFEKWTMEGLPLTEEVPKVEIGDFVPCIPGQNIVVSTEYVLRNLNNPDVVLVDANLSSWYYGGFLAYSKRGHIPNAVNVPYPAYFNDDKTWKLVSELKDMFEALGAVPEKEIIVYCGGNPAGSCLFFTLRHILGYINIRLYFDSLISWLADSRILPLYTYANEHMLRDAEWVRWFAGERIQYLVRDSKVRTVDVRSRDKYKAGHIPCAVNIPVDELVNDSSLDLTGWGNLLGRNGIGVDMEVVIYDDEINVLSSLFFWLMEYFGHREVSVLIGGLPSWIEKGFNVSTQDTIIAKPRHKFDVAICPTSYQIKLQKWKRFSNQQEYDDSSRFPRVWLVSSSKAKRVSNEITKSDKIYIPWEDNSDEKGRIKSAGELASMYESAGIDKTSEIICFSESLHESTFSYFILRLLGYPIIRVFLPKKGILGEL